MRAGKRQFTRTDESNIEPSSTVDEPYCRTTVSAGGQLFGRGGMKAHARIDVEGRTSAPSAVAAGLGGGIGMLISVLGGLLAAAGCAALGKLILDVDGLVVFCVSVSVGLAVGTAAARSTLSRFQEGRVDALLAIKPRPRNTVDGVGAFEGTAAAQKPEDLKDSARAR
jgi:hypothetical protein